MTPLVIVGGGPVGTLLALLLARRGRSVAIYERRSDPRTAPPERGRSINLALAARGLRALAAAGAVDALRPLMTAMPGRILHDVHGQTRFLPYGQHAGEVNWSISRAELNRALIALAGAQPLISLHFDQRCLDADPDASVLRFRDERTGSEYLLPAQAVIATDGAGSAVRAALVRRDRCHASEAPLQHDYKELLIPAGPDGHWRIEAHGLHIWPRGGHMLIALPNSDGSFTATLFLPRTGTNSFDSLHSDTSVRDFFGAQFADIPPLIPDLEDQFRAHPQGALATLHCWPWHSRSMLLVGDAAHAIVPFHGQGLNCGFEDCLLLDALLEGQASLETTFGTYEHQRRQDTDAIAQMAIENYDEMRDMVRRPDFAKRRELALALERLHPQQFIPRYSMVMFHPEIGYAEALHRGQTQERVLDVLVAEGAAAESVRATQLVNEVCSRS